MFHKTCDFDLWPWQRLKMHLSTLKMPFFFYFLLFLSFSSPFAFPLQAKQNMWRLHFINQTWRLNTNKTGCFVNVSPLYSSLWDDKFFELDFFPPWCSYCVAHEVNLLTGHRGTELISLSTQIFCVCYSCHISVRCGSSSSWNNEAMFHD